MFVFVEEWVWEPRCCPEPVLSLAALDSQSPHFVELSRLLWRVLSVVHLRRQVEVVESTVSFGDR